MKTLLLMRHAKSSWENESLSDFERPLTKRGLRDAPRIGTLIKNTHLKVDAVIASPAKRARKTANCVAEAAGLAKPEFIEEIYEASAQRLLRIIRDFDDARSTVLMVGHNPGFEALLGHLCGPGASIRVPTAALGCVELAIDRWDDIDAGKGTLLWFLAPRVLGPRED